MTLHNYWWLLIWLFIAGGFTFIIPPYQEEIVLGKKCVRWHWLHAAILALPYVIWAAWRTNSFGDTGQYRATFLGMPTGLVQFGSYIASRPKGKLFVTFEYMLKTFISDSAIFFFFIIALIQFLCIVYIYRRYSRNYWFSMFLFIASTDYMSWVFNGMRQFVSVTLIFACLPLLVKRKYLLMTIIVLLASQIHAAALVFLPIIFLVNGRVWNFRTTCFIGLIIISILMVDRVSGFITRAMEDTAYEGDIEIYLNDDGTNIMRVLFYSVPALMSLVFRSYIDASNNPFINMCANLSIIAAGFYVFSYFTSGILVGAIPIYFSLANYILIPWLITEVFEPSSAMLVNTVFVGVYCFFFYYQMGPTWGLL